MDNHELTNAIFKSSNFAAFLADRDPYSPLVNLSDICIISSNNVKFHVHKCVLTMFSDYFNAMFRSGLKESTAKEVKIHDIHEDVMKPVINFLYTGRIQLTDETIEDILKAANFLQIQLLMHKCYTFLADKLDVKNCLDILIFADENGLFKLFKKTSKFASAHFEKVCSHPDFMRLDQDQLRSIISNQELRVTSEEQVFFNLIKWIEHDKEKREENAKYLFSNVRYWLLSVNFIKQHRSKLPRRVECLEMICTWLEWHSSPDGQRVVKPMKYSKPNKPYGLMLVGGGGIQTYDPELNIWLSELIPNLPYRFDKVIAVKNKLVFSWLEKHLICFDLRTQEVTTLPKMHVKRRNYGMAVLNNELYVVGGQKYLSPWKRVVEKYNFSTGKWQDVAPMNSIFTAPKVAVLNGHLYVAGDRSPNMECLNPATNEWTSKPIPDLPKSAFGFAEAGGNLYKIGGAQYSEEKNGKDVYFKNLQSFDPSSDTWTPMAQMKIALTDPHCISWHGRLITCGGRDESGTSLNLVQEYNPHTNEWRAVAQLVEYNYSHDYALVAFK